MPRYGPCRTRAVAVAAAFLLAAAPLAFGLEEALKPKVGLASFLNETGEESSGLVVKVVEDTLELSLRLLGTYRVERIGSGQVGIEELRAAAESGSYDSIIVGSVAADAQGGYLLQARLYDRLKSGYSISREERAERVFEIFDAAERLMRGFLESMSGTHVGFGSIDFANSGEKGRYEVRIDGESAGFDVTRLDLVLNGPHVVTVVQERMLGEVELARSELVVLEGEGYELSFAVPYELPEERAEIERLYEAARGLRLGREALGKAEEALERLRGLLGETSYSPRLSEELKEGEGLARLVPGYAVRFEVEGRAQEPMAEHIGPLRELRAGLEEGEEELRGLIEETAAIEAVLLELAAGRQYSGREYAKAYDTYEEIKRLVDLLPAVEAAYYKTRLSELEKVAEEGLARRKGPSPGLLIGSGAALMAGSAILYSLDLPGQTFIKAEEAYRQYLEEVDLDEVARLRDEAEGLYLSANVQTGFMLGGAALGPILSGLGIWSATVTSPEARFKKSLGNFLKPAIEGANRFDKARKADPVCPVLLSSDMSIELTVQGLARSPAPIRFLPEDGDRVNVAGTAGSEGALLFYRTVDLKGGEPASREGSLTYLPLEVVLPSSALLSLYREKNAEETAKAEETPEESRVSVSSMDSVRGDRIPTKLNIDVGAFGIVFNPLGLDYLPGISEPSPTDGYFGGAVAGLSYQIRPGVAIGGEFSNFSGHPNLGLGMYATMILGTRESGLRMKLGYFQPPVKNTFEEKEYQSHWVEAGLIIGNVFVQAHGNFLNLFTDSPYFQWAGVSIGLSLNPTRRVKSAVEDEPAESVSASETEGISRIENFSSTGTVYTIGDIGPAGGIVFYDKGNDEGGWRYLEAASFDQSEGIAWKKGTKYDITFATRTAIGGGAANTETIIKVQGRGDTAASFCDTLTLGGLDDWFLPSRDELNLMFERRDLIGGFAPAMYWSSTEGENTLSGRSTMEWAWSQSFETGRQEGEGPKQSRYRVRAIRAFALSEGLKPATELVEPLDDSSASRKSEMAESPNKPPFFRYAFGINYTMLNPLSDETVWQSYYSQGANKAPHKVGFLVGVYMRIFPFLYLGMDATIALGLGNSDWIGYPTVCAVIGSQNSVGAKLGFFPMGSEGFCAQAGISVRKFAISAIVRTETIQDKLKLVAGGATLGFLY